MIKYKIEFKPRALKDCEKIPKHQLECIFSQIDKMSNDLNGNVKRLTNFTPEYRLRVGDYRILFETVQSKIVIYRVRHRKDVYK